MVAVNTIRQTPQSGTSQAPFFEAKIFIGSFPRESEKTYIVETLIVVDNVEFVKNGKVLSNVQENEFVIMASLTKKIRNRKNTWNVANCMCVLTQQNEIK